MYMFVYYILQNKMIHRFLNESMKRSIEQGDTMRYDRNLKRLH